MPERMISQILVDVAMGRSPADLVVRGGRWVSVQSGEIIPETDIAVIQGRIAYIGPDPGRRPLSLSRSFRWAHACRIRHAYRDPIRARRHSTWYDRHVH